MTDLMLNEMPVEDIQKMVLNIAYQAERATYDKTTYKKTGVEWYTHTVSSWYELEDELCGTTPGAPFNLSSGFELYMVQQVGGEGQGDIYYFVFAITDGIITRTFRVEGYYNSYDGASFDGEEMYEVKPVQKTVTVWE